MRALHQSGCSSHCSGRVAAGGTKTCSSHSYLPPVRLYKGMVQTKRLVRAACMPRPDEQQQSSQGACEDKPAAGPTTPYMKLALSALLPAAMLWLGSASAAHASTVAAAVLGSPALLCSQSAGATAWSTLITAALALVLLQAASPSSASTQRAMHARWSSTWRQAAQLVTIAWATARKSHRGFMQLCQAVPVNGSIMPVAGKLQRPRSLEQAQQPTRRAHSTGTAAVCTSPRADAEADAVLQGGLTGTTIEQVRIYAELTADSGYNPAAILVRNQALATAAALSVTCALKECQPHVQQVLDEMLQQRLGASASTALPTSSARASMLTEQSVPQDDDSCEPVQRAQEAAVRQLVCRELSKLPSDGDGVQYSEELTLRVMQAVAAQAALEEVHALVSVVVAAQQDEMVADGSGSRMAGPYFNGDASKDVQ